MASSIRAMEAAERRQQREAQKRQRELERQAKENAKLSAIEQARLEVQRYENRLDVLLSVHKEQGPIWDWATLATKLPPPPPRRGSYYEFKTRQQIPLLPPAQRERSLILIEQAQQQDEQMFRQVLDAHARETAEWQKLKGLALRIIAGEHKAYTEALAEQSPLAEISELGSTLHFTVHDAHLLECGLKVNGVQAIPSEVKTLTAGDKLSVKAMARVRYHELYQDYISGCMLRVAREVFALLPVETLLVTASVDWVNPGTGHPQEKPVLSAAITRNSMACLDFAHLDPSDAVESFFHRGDFKASRKAGAFAPILPITPADIPKSISNDSSLQELLAGAQRLREELKTENSDIHADQPNPEIQE